MGQRLRDDTGHVAMTEGPFHQPSDGLGGIAAVSVRRQDGVGDFHRARVVRPALELSQPHQRVRLPHLPGHLVSGHLRQPQVDQRRIYGLHIDGSAFAPVKLNWGGDIRYDDIDRIPYMAPGLVTPEKAA